MQNQCRSLKDEYEAVNSENYVNFDEDFALCAIWQIQIFIVAAVLKNDMMTFTITVRWIRKHNVLTSQKLAKQQRKLIFVKVK